jgi:CRISPR-associated exonuclease Cas4
VAPGQAGPDMPERDGEPIPLSALQHAVFCLRQAALIHIERLWDDNRFTAEGHVLPKAPACARMAKIWSPS